MKALAEQIAELDAVETYGRVVGVRGLMVEVAGPIHAMSVGARVVIETSGRRAIPCEVVGFSGKHALLMPFAALEGVRDELPHSIATRVTEWEWPYIRCEVLVERDSQKGIVIGLGGGVLKQAGTAVREQLPPGAYLDLHVTVDKDWQRRPRALERLGY